MKTSIVTFFDSYPPRSGSGVVCSDFFNSWPHPKKKLFQLSIKKNKIKNINTIKIYKNMAIFKIMCLPILAFQIMKYFKSSKKKILIIEGPSWIFYSFFLIILFKSVYKNIFIVYRSHSIEFEIRKRNSFFFIKILTKFFENYVIKKSNISTSVSKLEKKLFYRYYNKETYLFPNSINLKNLRSIKIKKINNIPKKFILFCGSYDYKPNKLAIDFIIKDILPSLENEQIYLVLTGNHKKSFNNKFILNLGFVKKTELKYLHKKSICLFTPITEGYGTRIKILEAIAWNNRVISTTKGIEGIEYTNQKNIIVTNNKKKMIKSIIKLVKKQKTKYLDPKLNIVSMKHNALTLFKVIQKKYV